MTVEIENSDTVSSFEAKYYISRGIEWFQYPRKKLAGGKSRSDTEKVDCELEERTDLTSGDVLLSLVNPKEVLLCGCTQ